MGHSMVIDMVRQDRYTRFQSLTTAEIIAGTGKAKERDEDKKYAEC